MLNVGGSTPLDWGSTLNKGGKEEVSTHGLQRHE